MRQIPLRNRLDEVVSFAMVDDEDYDALMARRWHRSVDGYAMSTVGPSVKLWMHRVVYERAYGEIAKPNVDHENRNRLDNQRGNLREATHTENVLNRELGRNNTTGFFGVRKDRRTGRFQAYSSFGGDWFSIGYFDSDRDAAIAHDAHMKATYPNEFLNLNIPDAEQSEIDRVSTLLTAPKQRKGKSRYRGVIHFPYDGREKCWHARIKVEGRNHGAGYYRTEEEAAFAYNQKATELLGDKATLNILPESLL